MNRIQRKFIEDAIDQSEKLNAWECDFIQSLDDLPEDCELSDNQNQKLNEISQKLN